MLLELAEQVQQQRHLLLGRREVDDLAHPRGGDRLGLGRELLGAVHVLVGQLEHAIAQRRREQHALALLARRHASQQEADVLDEAEVEHAVGLVDHDGLDRAERHHVLLEVVDQAARRRDHDVAAGLEQLALLVVVDAAVDQRRAQTGVAADVAEVLVDLDRQLARRREDHRARFAVLALGDGRARQQAVHHGDQEGAGLAGAGLRLAGDVASGQGDRQRQRLDRRAAGEACGVQAGQQAWMKIEAVEEDVGERLLMLVWHSSVGPWASRGLRSPCKRSVRPSCDADRADPVWPGARGGRGRGRGLPSGHSGPRSPGGAAPLPAS